MYVSYDIQITYSHIKTAVMLISCMKNNSILLTDISIKNVLKLFLNCIVIINTVAEKLMTHK